MPSGSWYHNYVFGPTHLQFYYAPGRYSIGGESLLITITHSGAPLVPHLKSRAIRRCVSTWLRDSFSNSKMSCKAVSAFL